METADRGSTLSAGLPPINLPDPDRIKREESDYRRYPSMNNSYPAPPPPSLPHVSGPSALSGPALSGLLSPPESRRTSGDEKEPPRQHQRQSLPSIHEALSSAAEPPPLPYSAAHPPPPPSSIAPPATSTPTHPFHHPLDPSPRLSQRAFPMDRPNQSPSHPYSQSVTRSPFMNSLPPSSAPSIPPPPPLPVSTSAAPPPSSDPTSRPVPFQPSSSSHTTSKLSALQPIRTQPLSPGRGNSSYPYSARQHSPAYDTTPQSAGPAGPMYYPYPQNHPFSAPPPGSTSQPHPPSFPPGRHPHEWRGPPEADHGDDIKKSNRSGPAAYGESIKRHLDNFDLEASLNQIAESSGQILQFTKTYGQRAHQSHRTGLVPGLMPNIPEVDGVIKEGTRIQDALSRIREVVLTQRAALQEQTQEQRFKGSNGFEHEEQDLYRDENNKAHNSFGGNDAKKQRRGRAAPPGRCHSCNRAETPEWRRGPDGARTLCNACGLHYAKLTRKMGSNKAAMTSSNLRPKSMNPNSPAP